jgi:ecotin
MKPFILLLCIGSRLCVLGAEHPNLKPFPESVDELIRSVIVLPELEKEEEFNVEILPGEVRMTDGVNFVRMGGTIEAESLEGWGYTYYIVKPGPVMSTLMAPSPDQPEVEAFVSMKGELIRYNSKLPVVVYHPEGMEIRYRIWQAGEVQMIR